MHVYVCYMHRSESLKILSYPDPYLSRYSADIETVDEYITLFHLISGGGKTK